MAYFRGYVSFRECIYIQETSKPTKKIKLHPIHPLLLHPFNGNSLKPMVQKKNSQSHCQGAKSIDGMHPPKKLTDGWNLKITKKKPMILGFTHLPTFKLHLPTFKLHLPTFKLHHLKGIPNQTLTFPTTHTLFPIIMEVENGYI